MLTANLIADVCGGDVLGDDIARIPGPGHSSVDRSLSVKVDLCAPGGFVAFSHAGDDIYECLDYVRAKLGLPLYSARKESWNESSRSYGGNWVMTA